MVAISYRSPSTSAREPSSLDASLHPLAHHQIRANTQPRLYVLRSCAIVPHSVPYPLRGVTANAHCERPVRADPTAMVVGSSRSRILQRPPPKQPGASEFSSVRKESRTSFKLLNDNSWIVLKNDVCLLCNTAIVCAAFSAKNAVYFSRVLDKARS